MQSTDPKAATVCVGPLTCWRGEGLDGDMVEGVSKVDFISLGVSLGVTHQEAYRRGAAMEDVLNAEGERTMG